MRRFLFLIFLFLSFSLVSYAEPPIEVISWQSSDVKLPSQEEIDYLGEIMVEVQSFIASEMDRYGFGPKTFDFNKNIRGVKGKLRVQEYTSTIIRNESSFIEKAWNNQIYVVFLKWDESYSCNGCQWHNYKCCWVISKVVSEGS